MFFKKFRDKVEERNGTVGRGGGGGGRCFGDRDDSGVFKGRRVNTSRYS